jgi:hypothetical protein
MKAEVTIWTYREGVKLATLFHEVIELDEILTEYFRKEYADRDRRVDRVDIDKIDVNG